jgi:hypothetical protein
MPVTGNNNDKTGIWMIDGALHLFLGVAQVLGGRLEDLPDGGQPPAGATAGLPAHG